MLVVWHMLIGCLRGSLVENDSKFWLRKTALLGLKTATKQVIHRESWNCRIGFLSARIKSRIKVRHGSGSESIGTSTQALRIQDMIRSRYLLHNYYFLVHSCGYIVAATKLVTKSPCCLRIDKQRTNATKDLQFAIRITGTSEETKLLNWC